MPALVDDLIAYVDADDVDPVRRRSSRYAGLPKVIATMVGLVFAAVKLA